MADSAWLELASLPKSLDSSKRCWYWLETQLCFPGMLLAQQTSPLLSVMVAAVVVVVGTQVRRDTAVDYV